MKDLKKNHKKRSADIGGKKAFVISSIIGVLSSFISMIFMTLAMAGICMTFDDPHKFIVPLCMFVIYSSSVIGGLIAARISKEKSILCSALSGLLFTLAVWMIFTVLDIYTQNKADGIISFAIKLSLTPASMLGGILGIDRGRKIHNHRKKH
jgi:putative membrane protein (TIGR04086 family)